jgi:hypothetical protein
MKIDDDLLYDVEGLAKVLLLSENTVRKKLVSGELKGKKLGKKWYMTGSAIRAYFAEGDDEKLDQSKDKK